MIGVKYVEDRCIVCGEIVSEGRMVCWQCEHKFDGDIYHYTVNTFDSNFEPVQLNGEIKASSHSDVLIKLIATGVVNPKGWEFLELYKEGCSYDDTGNSE
jgi:hypothetical protein